MSARRRFPHPLLLAVPPLGVTFALTYFLGIFHAARSSTGADPESTDFAKQSVVRFTDLPPAPVRGTDDLPLAPLERTHALTEDELTPELVRKADEVLWQQDPPMGAEVPIQLGDKIYIGRIERHFHEVGGPKRPWGYHKGITLYSSH